MKLDAVYHTVEQEKSAAHTFSYVGAVGVLAELTRQVGGNVSLDVELLTKTIPAALAAGLAVREPFESLTCLLPLQLFTYHLALQRGTNPDSFRLDDPRFAAAMARVKL